MAPMRRRGFGEARIPGYDEFELDVERVLKEQLPRFFESVESASLTQENVQAIPERAKGAYLLLHRGQPVYAGKTDARHGFRDRLTRHWFTVQHRERLDTEDMAFKAVRIMVFSNFDVEAILIARMRDQDAEALPWNDSGFGSNDPGHNRERQEPAKFDRTYPIAVDRPLDLNLSGEHTVHDILLTMKDALPYLIRFEHHGELQDARVVIPTGPVTTSAVMTAIVHALPTGQWQATIFPDRVILYRGREDYGYARFTIR